MNEKFDREDAKAVLDWLMPAMHDFYNALSRTDQERWDTSRKKRTVLPTPDTQPTATNMIQTVTYTVIPPDFLKGFGWGGGSN